jgi:hypothetical protein
LIGDVARVWWGLGQEGVGVGQRQSALACRGIAYDAGLELANGCTDLLQIFHWVLLLFLNIFFSFFPPKAVSFSGSLLRLPD